MRIISFRKFKENCIHLEHYAVYTIDECAIGDCEPIHLRAGFEYQPCDEKNCPVLRDCKEVEK